MTILDRFVALVSRSGWSKRLLWRGWYQFLATRYRDPSWTFMNYGYRTPEGPGVSVDPADEANRSCIQLYDVVARAVPIAGRDLLEVGCGRGGGAAYVARAMSPSRVVGVDLSPRAIALCQQRFSLPNLSFAVGDAEQLPFADGAFDVVLNVESSHCYGRFGVFLREVRRVLRPGGHFAYADFRPRDEIDRWRGALQAAGFIIAGERDLRPGVVAALDTDDAGKRALIERLVDRPLVGIFREFAALRGSTLNEALRRGDFGYYAFALTKT
ncbi:MAG TPA: class I SAM-dependent methyltransferase [Polyangia bacterium]|nr:class I SAM-dependent methyltransferase [Polyangia bacterium]